MNDLFAEHVRRHEMFEELASLLLSQSSLLGLHAWYQSSEVFRAASDDAESAARILLGMEPHER
jgi:hypothetical protein